jgi:hypothetical protein
LLSYSRSSLPFMVPKGSLPYWQQPTTGPCPELYESSPTLSSYFHKIHFNIIIIPSMHRSSEWSFPFKLSNQKKFFLHVSCCMPSPSHPPSFDLRNNIWKRVQIMEFLIVQFSPVSCHIIPVRSKFVFS